MIRVQVEGHSQHLVLGIIASPRHDSLAETCRYSHAESGWTESDNSELDSLSSYNRLECLWGVDYEPLQHESQDFQPQMHGVARLRSFPCVSALSLSRWALNSLPIDHRVRGPFPTLVPFARLLGDIYSLGRVGLSFGEMIFH